MNKTGYLESAMEWLLNHPEGEDEEEEENEEMPAEPEVPKVPLTPEEKAQKIIEMEELRIMTLLPTTIWKFAIFSL